MTSSLGLRYADEAAEYQRFILGKLGDDDPAEVQVGTPSALRELFREAGDRLRTRPAPSEWSVLEVAGHMLDAEVVASARYRWILAEDEPGSSATTRSRGWSGCGTTRTPPTSSGAFRGAPDGQPRAVVTEL
ncbi:MAG: hypothetical protein ACRDKA_15730 [Actinomycetota bacterium]